MGNWRDQVWVPLAFPSEEAASRRRARRLIST
jgi:hypothetical protein